MQLPPFPFFGVIKDFPHYSAERRLDCTAFAGSADRPSRAPGFPNLANTLPRHFPDRFMVKRPSAGVTEMIRALCSRLRVP
jgi:hypothetical protein